MKVLVDTTVWSLALRRPKDRALDGEQSRVVDALADLIRDGRAVLLGAIRQELLCGIRSAQQFEQLRLGLAAFEDLALPGAVYESAAQAFNHCRANGVQGSNTDFLICAAAMHHGVPIFSTDADFAQYQRWLPIQRFAPAELR